MRYSEMFLPTVREVPSDAETVSHKLMIRAGMIRKLTSGIYSYLPLGYRVIRKVENIVREEMNAAGALHRVDRHDRGVIQRRKGLGLVLEASEAFGMRRDRVRKDFDGDRAPEGRVERLPDDAHAALTDTLQQTVVGKEIAGFHVMPSGS